MKRIVVVTRPHRRQLRAGFRTVLLTGKAYFLLSFCSMAVFLLLGLAGMLHNASSSSPVQSMKGFASAVSGPFFKSLLGMELPHSAGDPNASPFRTDRMAAFLVRFLTDLNPNDPRSLLALEMPGMSPDQSVLLRPGSGGDEAPEDRGPPAAEHRAGQASPDAADAGQPDEAVPSDSGGGSPPDPQPEPGSGHEPPQGAAETKDAGNRKVVFIYHSHNRESWFPELKPGAKDANSDKTNITLVGKRLARQLEANGVGAAQSSQDYAKSVKSYNWNFSYKYSLHTVQQALADNRSLKYFFDIHRDSQRRGKTTASIGGIDYAQVYFIIGHRNPHWKENEAFANRIHEKLEKQYPGLSRGIWGKTAANGNGEYNQSVSPDSVLIEIGGVENTLRECYRTADILAEAIADLIWESQDAEKVDGKAAGL